jgi:alpha-glucosidase
MPVLRTIPWWRSAVIYQIYPRSFADANGDGVGDLEGIRRRLDYLSWLGVDALWLSPIYPSPQADFGYDVADYCAIDPAFGTLDDFDRLLAEAHARGLRVLLDWVLSHTSDRHPWFREARASRDNPWRDWYVWRDRPNNWRAHFGGSAWTFDPPTGQHYLHSFLPEQPDLNWRNPAVSEAMFGVMRFWLDRGVDGFRLDAVRRLAKDPRFRDNPASAAMAGEPGTLEPDLRRQLNHPDIHPILRRLRAEVDYYPGERALLGEVNLPTVRQIARYYGRQDELHLAFLFPLLHAAWDAGVWREALAEAAAALARRGAWPAWALSNHDNPRARTRYGSDARARAAVMALLTLRGTPVLYAGEELGLEDAVVPPALARDPGGRDGCRAPLPWDAEPDHGWPGARPGLPWPPEPEHRNVATEQGDPSSILNLVRRLLAARRASPALRSGGQRLLPTPPGVLAYLRVRGVDHRLALLNFRPEPVDVPVEGRWRVEVASAGDGEEKDYGGRIAADEGLLLRPA